MAISKLSLISKYRQGGSRESFWQVRKIWQITFHLRLRHHLWFVFVSCLLRIWLDSYLFVFNGIVFMWELKCVSKQMDTPMSWLGKCLNKCWKLWSVLQFKKLISRWRQNCYQIAHTSLSVYQFICLSTWCLLCLAPPQTAYLVMPILRHGSTTTTTHPTSHMPDTSQTLHLEVPYRSRCLISVFDGKGKKWCHRTFSIC